MTPVTLRRATTGLMTALLLSTVISAFAAGPALPETYRSKDPKVKLTMVEFSAPWCISCQLLKPSVKKLTEDAGPELRLVELNIDEAKNQKMVKRYGVLATPTIVLFDTKGQALQRMESDVHPTELRKAVLGRLGKLP